MNEFELKFQVPPQSAAAVEAALRRGTVESTRLRACYFDTPDEALARHGLVLRVRQEGRERVQTAKGPGRGSFERLEHNVQLPVRAGAMPDIAQHQDHPIHALLVQALGTSRVGLQPTFETDVTRLSRTLQIGASSVEIALDRGEVRAYGRSQPVLEVEFELKEGSTAAVIELARSWCTTHQLWLDPVSKSGQGRRLAGGTAAAAAVRAEPPGGHRRHLLAAIIDSGMQQILGNARELAIGTGTDEHVHQLRVGLRRVRTALRELHAASAPPPLDPAVQAALRKLFGTLGEHRDRATLLPALLQEMASAGSPVPPWRPQLPDLGAAVRDAALQDAFLCLVGLAWDLRSGEGAAPKALRKLARKRLQPLHEKVLAGGRRFERLAQQDRHRVRKRLKRLRYAAESLRSLYDEDAVDAYVGALKKLQDVLGRYQDAVAGRSLFEQRALQEGTAWFGAGWLAAREQQLAADCAQASRRAARKARPFWR